MAGLWKQHIWCRLNFPVPRTKAATRTTRRSDNTNVAGAVSDAQLPFWMWKCGFGCGKCGFGCGKCGLDAESNAALDVEHMVLDVESAAWDLESTVLDA